MKVKIFWQEQCPNCPPAKILGKKLELEKNMDVTYFNIKEPEGLAEAVMFDVMSTPSVIVTDDQDNELKSWRGSVPNMDSIILS